MRELKSSTICGRRMVVVPDSGIFSVALTDCPIGEPNIMVDGAMASFAERKSIFDSLRLWTRRTKRERTQVIVVEEPRLPSIIEFYGEWADQIK